MGDVVPLHPRVTVEQVKAATWTASMHADLAKGGTLWVYGCNEYPRLAFSDLRKTRKDKTVRTFACDKEDFTTLEAAVAKLNGEELPPQEEKVPDEQKPTKQRKVPLSDQILEIKIILHERSQAYTREIEAHPDRKSKLEGRMEASRAALRALEWLRDNEDAVREYAAEKRKKAAPPEGGASQEAEAS